MKSFARFYWLVPLLLALAACAPLTRSEQPSHLDFESLGQRQTVGQSFFSRYAGLSAIEVFLEPGWKARGELFFHLKYDPKSQQDLHTASNPPAVISSPGFFRLDFPALPDSGLQSYYFYLHTNEDDGYHVGTSAADSYLNGSQYLNDLAVDAQTTFRLVYDPAILATGLFLEGLAWTWYVIVAFLLFILPGWALLNGLLPGWSANSWPLKVTFSIGVSLAVYPLLFLWTDLISLHLGPLYAWLPPVLAVAFLLIKNREDIRQRFVAMRRTGPGFLLPRRLWTERTPELVFILLAGVVLLARFWPARALPAPLWGDSYQHTVMAQLLVDNQGLFNDWKPYAEMVSFTYHFGFHSLVAVFHWMTGLPLPQATLWMGQILNALAVLSVYPLAARLGRSQWAGIIALLLAGLLSPMPMFYTNWGRYTQLAGQAILPAAALIAWEIYENRGDSWRSYLLAWIVFAGLALTHYRVLVFAALFILAYLIFHLRRTHLRELAVKTALMAVGTGILFLPWAVRLLGGNLPQILRAQITTPASQISAFTEQYNAIGNLFTYLPAWLWLLLPFSLAWGFWRRERDFALVSLWWFLIFISANPQWFNLPGSGTISNFAVFIAAYFPVSLLLGASGYWLVDFTRQWWKERSFSLPQTQALESQIDRWAPLLIVVLILIAGLWGARQRLRDIQPTQFSLVTWPDMRAAAWIQENLPLEARFLVNSFFAYGDSSIVGSDAGWWLPLIAKRATTLPPLTYASERGPRPDYHEWINALSAEIEAKGISHPDVLESLLSRGVTHVFIGQQQGSVNDPTPQLDPKEMLASPHFTPVYHQDRVWIFQLNQTGD